MKGDFKEMRVWSKAMELTIKTYEVVENLPHEEKYALGDQLRRCAVSIPSNIAEGHGRQTEKEFIQFLYIARGSLFELETQLLLCRQLYRVDINLINSALDLKNQIARMISSLISYFHNSSEHKKR